MSATILESLSLEKTGHFVRLAIGLVIASVVVAAEHQAVAVFWV